MILDKRYEMVRKMVREFAETEFTREVLEDLREKGDYNWEMHHKMADAGFFGVKTPKEYGGSGGDYLDYAIMDEELGRVSPVLCLYSNTPASLGSGPIMFGGTEEQKKKYLPAVASGEKMMCFGLTEPGAGSDAGGTTTTAVLDGDEYIVNGRKTFISGAPCSDWCLCFVKTDPTQKGSRGISLIVVDMHLPGVSCGVAEHKMGINGYPTSDIVFEDVRVPKDCIIGKVDKGFPLAMQTLDGGRLGIAAWSVGMAQGALEEAIKYAKERKQFGRRIADFQAISFMIAEMATQVEVGRQMTYHAAILKNANHPDAAKACSMAKLFCSEMCNDVCAKAVQVHGGYGYIRDYKVENFYRDCRVNTLFEGTSEVQKMVIAANVLK